MSDLERDVQAVSGLIRLKEENEFVADVSPKYSRELMRRWNHFNDMEDILLGVWGEWKDSENAKDPDADGYDTLMRIKSKIEDLGYRP